MNWKQTLRVDMLKKLEIKNHNLKNTLINFLINSMTMIMTKIKISKRETLKREIINYVNDVKHIKCGIVFHSGNDKFVLPVVKKL